MKNISTKTFHDNSMLSEQQLKNEKTTKPVNWLKPTGGAYPVLGPSDPIWIKVSKKKQRVYIMKGNKIIYTMVCSTGLDTGPDTSTPEGTFHIQRERGEAFIMLLKKRGPNTGFHGKITDSFYFIRLQLTGTEM